CGDTTAHVAHGHAVARLAAQLTHAGGAGVDVVDVEVRARALLAGLHVRDGQAALLPDPGHVVLGRAGVVLELPAEERAPELAALRRVVRRDLEVDYLAGPRPSSA